MSKPADERLVRVRTARAQSKARDQLRELLRDTTLIHALVIACDAEGRWTVLAGGMTAMGVAEAILVGTHAVERLLAAEAAAGGVGLKIALDATIPADGPIPNGGRRRKPEIKIGLDGELEAPPGEGFTFCGECGANRWFATHLDDGKTGRLACVGCGNEVAMIPVYHAEGRA